MNINEVLDGSLFLGFFLSLLCYWAASKIAKRFPYTILNPLLLSTIFIIAILLVFHIDYDTYNEGAQYLSYLLTPATICLAVPMYRQVQVLKKHFVAIFFSMLAGCIACALVIVGLSFVFGLDPQIYHALQPKSITTAIAIGVAEEAGANSTITVAAVILTGLIGAIGAKGFCRLLKITHPVAVGLACGNAAHAIGTSKALEFGEVEGAMSSLAIVTAGIMTVILVPLFA